MSLIPSLSLTEFKRMKLDDLKDLKSVEITADGEYLFTAIIPPRNSGITMTDVIKTEAEYLGVRGNTVGGRDPEEILNKVGEAV